MFHAFFNARLRKNGACVLRVRRPLISDLYCRLRTGTTIIGERRSKGHTNPANLANLVEREESRSSLCLSNVERSKNTDDNKMPIYFTS